MRGRGTRAEGRWLIEVSPEVERAIIRDYCTPSLSLAEVKARNGVTEWTVNKIRLKWGLRRYRTNADPRARTIQETGTPLHAPAEEPVAKRRRCACGGVIDLDRPEVHNCRHTRAA